MNHLEKRQRKIHPIESNNIICKCLFISTVFKIFSYTLKIFRKNFQKDNADEEMYEVPSNYESKNINDQLETKWNRLQENRQNVSVARLLLSCYGLTFFLLGLFKLITSIIMLVVQPYATAKLVSYFAPNTNLTKKDAYFYAAILIGLKLSNSIVTHNYYLLLAGLGIKISTALCTLVYKRILKMKQFHFQNIGQVVTVITKDVNVVKKFINYGNDTWIGITQAVVLSFVLYRKIGLAALIGMTFLWLSLLLQIYIVIKIFPSKKKMCEKTDERYKIVQEALSSIKLIRMYVWEKFFEEKISQARTQEVNATRKIFVIKLVGSIINTLNTNITLYILLMSYLIFGNNITAEVVFYTVTCCDLLETGLTQMFLKALYVIAEFIICIKRIENLLTLPNSGVKQESKNDSVVLSKIHFNNTVLRIENKEIFRGINLTIQKGLILITGYVNSGKTSLLKLILQEYEPESGNLQIQGSVSYASQEPWLFPSTIRQNILFGEPYNEMRYQKVLQVCALTYDLELFDYGDLTIIEDQGFNLSKGQQIRINLARAVYQQAEIYLLDDCLTGLDAKVGRFIFKECIQKFLQEKMVILVTNDTNYLKCANNVIIVNNSELKSITNNPITKIAESDDESKTRENSYLADTNEDEESTENSLLIGKKKVYQENNKVGKLDSDVYVRYIKFAGGFLISILVFCVFIATEFFIGYKMKVIKKKTVGNVGLVISQAIRMTAVLQRGARRWVEVENYMTSVERVLQYIDTEKENKFGLTLKNWPERGEIKFQNVSLIHNNCEQPTLRKINFMVKPNEKIGIVGRTGAGKSSLISIFFRLYKFQGRITIDDVDIKTLSLEFLRSKISVIPQDALVFTGTIRDNVDPTCQCTDEEIWHFLKCVHLDEIIPSLDFKIVENGQNFSAGQKQLICVARALARKNKIVILDEATANLDPENDVLVHNVIEKHFAVSTVLIIAHKLQSVLKCNKVIVLEKGVIVEFGKPTDLLRNENGPFYKLYVNL
ncbi:ABC tran domain containing protein [Asbolus verrucosus]|uniref:ABC tran domain containing protein n=1 Tax=Asbolus verrucosus TaxID=1661398 RepID=A0A482WDE9_ASBVE|nr:ABC tran domain containing protein [Asbolus verrucosus]